MSDFITNANDRFESRDLDSFLMDRRKDHGERFREMGTEGNGVEIVRWEGDCAIVRLPKPMSEQFPFSV